MSDLDITMTEFEDKTQDDSTRMLTGKDYPELCQVCRSAIDACYQMIGEDLAGDTDDSEAPCNLAYDLRMFCGKHECINKPKTQEMAGDAGLWYVGWDGMGSYEVFHSNTPPQEIINGYIIPGGRTYACYTHEGFKTEQDAKGWLDAELNDFEYDVDDDMPSDEIQEDW